MRRAACAVLLVVLATTWAACGNAERQQGSDRASTADRVDVVLMPRGREGQQLRKSVTCTTVDDRCRRLRKADFSPPDADQVCTQVYGGPAVATVKGKAGGRAVDATFELANGCQVARWERFSWLLGDPPLQR